MGNCQVKFNTQGQITDVLTSEGKSSTVFRELSSIPTIDSEQAMEMSKIIYSEGYTYGEVFFVAQGKDFNNYKDALKEGGEIKIIVGSTQVGSVSSNTNPNTKTGLVNKLILDDLIQDRTILEDGNKTYLPFGYAGGRANVSMDLIRDSIKGELSRDYEYKVDDAGNFTLEPQGINPNEPLDKIKAEYGESVAKTIGRNRFATDILERYTSKSPLKQVSEMSEEQLRNQLTELLSNMGVKLMSIEEYQKQYKQRKGVDVTAEAFADIANSVIAYQGGDISIDTLMEETFHFILEATPEAELSEALREVESTDTYKEESSRYRDIYSKQNPNMSKEEIETLVKKEMLAKEIVKNISKGREASQNSSLFQRIIDIINNFFSRLNITRSHQTKMNSLTNMIGEMIVNRNLSEGIDLNLLDGVTYTMYSVQSSANENLNKLHMTLLAMVRELKSSERIIAQTKSAGSAVNKRSIDQLEFKILNTKEEVAIKTAVVEYLKILDSKVREINTAVDSTRAGNKILGQAEYTLLQQLSGSQKENLASLADTFRNTKGFESYADEVQKVSSDILAIEGKVINSTQEVVDNILDKALENAPTYYLANEQDKQAIRDRVMQYQEDTNVLYTWYGQLSHAKDPILGLLARTIGNMHNRAQLGFASRVKNLVADLKKHGFESMKDANRILHKEGDYVRNYADNDYVDNYYATERAKAHNEALKYSGKPEVELEKLTKYYLRKERVELTTDEMLSTDIEMLVYEEAFEEATLYTTERMFTPEYYKERRAKHAHLSLTTRAFLRNQSKIRASILRSVTNESGKVVHNKSSQTALQELRNNRATKENIYVEGEIRDGLEVDYGIEGRRNPAEGWIKYSNNVFIKMKDGVTEETHPEAILAYELAKQRDMYNQEKQTGASTDQIYYQDGLSETFLEDLIAMEERGASRRDIIDFAVNNTMINFNDSFWENAFGDQSFADTAQEYARHNSEDYEFKSELVRLKELTAQRSALLKGYRDPSNPSNFVVANMGQLALDEIHSLSNSIDDAKSKLRSIEGFRQYLDTRDLGEGSQGNSEYGPNESWYGDLQDAGIERTADNLEKIIRFAEPHISARNQEYMIPIIQDLNRFAKGGILHSNTRRMLNRRFGEGYAESLPKAIAKDIALQLLESSLDVYYKAVTPVSVSEVMRRLKDQYSDEKVSDVLKELGTIEGVRLNNHYSYYEQSEVKYYNNKYNTELGYRYQPNFDSKTHGEKFKDKEFWNKYQLKYGADGRGFEAGANKSEYEAWKVLTEFNKNTLEYYNAQEHSMYSKPNVTKTDYEKFLSVTKGKSFASTAKDWVESFGKFRLEEMAEGEMANGESIYKNTGIRIIPKMHLQRLEVEGVRTDDYMFGYVTVANSASIYEARVNTYSDVLALQNNLLDRRTIEGKEVRASNTYKMFRNYVDSNFYGINETANRRVKLPIVGEVDIAKLVSSFHTFIRWKNLSNNIIVPVTSYLTGQNQLFQEKLVGQYIDKDSHKKAQKYFRSNFGTAFKEGLKLNPSSEMVLMMEHLGMFNIAERFKNSDRSTFERGLANLGYGAHTATNFEPFSIAFMSVLYGHRMYKGANMDTAKLMDYNTFKKIRSSEQATPKQIQAEWKQLEGKSMKDYLTITDRNTMKMNVDKYAEDSGLTRDEASKEMLSARNFVTTKAKQLVQRVDGTIRPEERTMLQRNFLGKYAMTHKGWMAIALATRFKQRQFNFMTLQEEEGVYVTASRQLYNTIIGFTKGDFNINKRISEASEIERVNMKRFWIEMGIASTMFMLAIMFGAYADRDDKKDVYGAQLLTYLLERANNEVSSQQLGLFGEVYGTVKEPIVGLQQIADIFKVHGAFDFDEVKTGRYRGMKGYQKYFINNFAPLKQGYLLWNADNIRYQRNAYRNFNDPERFQILSLMMNKERAEALVGH